MIRRRPKPLPNRSAPEREREHGAEPPEPPEDDDNGDDNGDNGPGRYYVLPYVLTEDDVGWRSGLIVRAKNKRLAREYVEMLARDGDEELWGRRPPDVDPFVDYGSVEALPEDLGAYYLAYTDPEYPDENQVLHLDVGFGADGFFSSEGDAREYLAEEFRVFEPKVVDYPWDGNPRKRKRRKRKKRRKLTVHEVVSRALGD